MSTPPAPERSASPVAPALRAGAALALGASGRRRATGLALVAVVLTIVGAAILRRGGVAGALERSLSTSLGFVVPLTSFAAAQALLGPQNLREGLWPAARFGHPRALVALGRAATLVALTALTALACGVAAVLGVLPHPGVALLAELGAVAWIAALSGASYGAWFALASSFGRRGGGRTAFLALDFVLGAWGAFGVVLPRGLTANLLALEAPLALPQRAASGLLVVSVALALLGVAWRASDARRA